MESLIFRSFFLVFLRFKLSVYSAFSAPDFESTNCTNAGSYADDSPFKRNLDTVLSEISSNTNIDYGYYNFSAGDGPDRANAIALCIGDRPIDECRSCVYNATLRIIQNCPNQIEAVGLYPNCLLRYSNKSIKSNDDMLDLHNPVKVADIDGYNEAAVYLSERLRDEAASGSSTRKLATGVVVAPSSKTIYGLIQCAPDLSKQECQDCLNRGIRHIPRCCKGNDGLRLIQSVCVLQYENHRFYSGSPTLTLSLLSPQSPPVVDSVPEFERTNCTDAGSYTDDGPYKKNLDTVLSEISSDTNIDYGYYNFSAGNGAERVYAIALCIGDQPIVECRSCVYNATIRITRACPNQIEAAGLYPTCMLRYSDKPIISNDDMLDLYNPVKVADVDGYNEAVVKLTERLRDEAASGSSTRKLATGEIVAPASKIIYGLLQCAPDLSKLECQDCLNRAIQYIPSCCKGNDGVRLIPSVCFLQYENHPFYSGSPSSSTPSLSPPPPPVGNRARTIIIIVVTSVAGLIIILAITFVLIFRKRKHADSTEGVECLPLRERDEDEIFTAETLQFDFAVIKAATDDFAVENKLGEGGFGPVYKGRLSNGETIAVKRLSRNSGQGDLEFKNEVVLVGKLQHRNLVRLLGFSLLGSERLLVYEFVPNASLDHFIFDPQRREDLDWDRRFKIICGIARGLLYLHEDSRLRIIHRDLKASNILLDAEMNAKIADFGLAKLFEVDETQGNTSRVVGTYGYMSPEYLLHGQFSVKSDVFSFGVIILEIVSGQKNSCFRNEERVEDLLSYVWKRWREGRASNVIDPTLSSGSKNEMTRCIHIGLLCVQENPVERPTMASVVLMLNSFSVTLPVPRAPSFNASSTAVLGAEKTESAASNSNSHGHSNEASITGSGLYPR